MSDVIVRVEGLGKRYRLNASRNNNSMRDSLNRALLWPYRALTQRARKQADMPQHGEFWALRDISFELHAGETLGIVGSNGSGKSTMLKVLSRITRPTTGMAEIRGRLGSLLEVGTGFHPDLTGRENVYLNGAMLGMSRAETTRKFEQIVDFSGVADFIDTPVKYYSSGMYIRLAFSVAAHLDSEVLLLDEVLQVGDIGFQAKSLEKVNEIAKDGRAVIIVSHAMDSISKLCDRALWLRHGNIVEMGNPPDVLAAYSEYELARGQGLIPD